MAIPQKDVNLHTFEGGMDSDTAPELMPPNRARFMLNVRSYTFGQKGVITNVMGNVLITTPLPDGNNSAHGWGADEENNEFYFIVYNSNGYHTVFMYDSLKNSVIVVLQSKTDSNGIDILTLDENYLIDHVDIIPSINGPLVTWCDGVNNAVKFNRNKAIDKTDAGYGTIIFRDYINAYKKCAVYAPVGSYTTDINRNSNFLYGKLFKFAVRFIYDDGEYSNWSDWSLVAYPPNQSFSGINNITYENNCIQVRIETGSPLVVKLEVGMLAGITDASGSTSPWVTTAILDKAKLNIDDSTTYVFKFYNDGADDSTNQSKIFRQYSFMPFAPVCQAFVKNAMTYTNFFEGFAVVNMDVEIDIAYQDLYLPDGTSNQLNHPVFLAEGITNGYTSKFPGYYYNSQWKFTIGFDVKTGNKFTLIGSNGTPSPKGFNFNFSYVAKAQDTAITVANWFKAALQTIQRGYPTGTSGITNEAIDGAGNVSWYYQILNHYKQSPMSWTGSVTPVNFQSLLDDGTSVNMVKPGSSRKYAVCYQDADGRITLAYTSDSMVINTDFITVTGDKKQAVHTIKIFNPPPPWAVYFYLLRTPDSGDWIQVLIQKVIKVDPDPSLIAAGNSQKYLDLVVGSLFTYQKLHPNTILKYDFEKGDRLRLIKYYDQNNNNAPVLYAPLETEILSYSINTIEQVNENIALNGTNIVTINGIANPDYVGKTLSVNGYQRTIIGTPAGNQYTLDSTVPEGSSQGNVNHPTFTISDTRGILRIKQPDGITINDLSLVELYKPQLNNSVDGYKQFFPFGVKLGIGNPGQPNAYHLGTVQNQYQNSPNDPAIITVVQGDAFARNRELPTNDSVPGTQLIIDHIIDPNFSDDYESDLSSLGRVVPQDDGSGVKSFGSRTRFSNNVVQDTKILGTNDFDELDRVDYNDPFGDIKLTKFRENRLYIFKFLKTGWAGVLQQRIESADGGGTMTTSVKLLSAMNYYSWDGGIGNNPESYVTNGNYIYFASAQSGVFLRIAGDGCDPISTLYNYDKEVRRVLDIVAKQGLRVFGGVDRENGEILFCVPGYNNYIFNGGFLPTDWNVNNPPFDPDNQPVLWEITQQPANSTVSINDGTFNLVAGSVVGSDYFVYRAQLADGSFTPARKECFTVAPPTNRVQAFQVRANTKYCVVRNHGFRVRTTSRYCVIRSTGFQARIATKYCVIRSVGFRKRLSTKYCLKRTAVPLDDFDFLVLRYIWADGSGIDLDSFTGLSGTGTIYDGNPTTRAGWVGYGQNPDPSTGATGSGSRVIPYGSSTPYLNWGTDNTGTSGIEAILVDLKQFITDFPSTPNPITVLMNSVWYNSLITGMITVEVTTYKGGTMALDIPTHNFVNTGGVLVDTVNLDYNVSLQSMAYLVTSSVPVARMDYDKTTNKATLTLIS